MSSLNKSQVNCAYIQQKAHWVKMLQNYTVSF